jgi:type III secretion protein J
MMPCRTGDALRALPRAAILLLLVALSACKTELYTGLNEREANRMVAVLLDQGIPADRRRVEDGTMTVFVEQRQFSEAVNLLRSHGLPQVAHATLAEVFQDDGLVSSPMAEKARMIFALGEELSRTISDIDGVLSARVHIVLPNDEGLKASRTPSSASVFVRHDRAVDLQEQLPQIKMLVANSVEGLKYELVSVVLFPVVVADPQGEGQPHLREVFGLWLHDASAPYATWLIVILGIVGVLGLGGIGVAVWLLLRRRQENNAARPLEETRSSPSVRPKGTAGKTAVTAPVGPRKVA